MVDVSELRKTSITSLILQRVLLIAALLVVVGPILLLVLNSLKEYRAIIASFFSLPATLQWRNYSVAWQTTEFHLKFWNSLLVTGLSVAGITLFGASGAYSLARNRSRFATVLLLVFSFSVLVPFPTLMIPLVRITASFGFHNNLFGLIVTYWGTRVPFAVFMVHGFVRAVPHELEEAAFIEGAGRLTIFFRLILPVIKPAIATVASLNTIWIWNDFLLPLLMIRREPLRTLPLMLFNLWGEYLARWEIIIPAMLLTVFPSVLAFLVVQKYVERGIVSGAVKG